MPRNNLRHGDTIGQKRTPEHKAWSKMLERCYNQKDINFPRYGGRGIVICPLWHKYEEFLAHVGRKPSSLHSIERIDNNGDYKPGNVRWATKKEQARNRSTNHILEYKGEQKTLAEWAEITGIRYSLLCKRLIRGWTIEKAIETPKMKNRWQVGDYATS